MEIQAGALAARDSRALRRVLVDHTPEMFAWLISLGMVFVGPMPEAPHRHPRMHNNVVPSSRSFAYHLTRHYRSLAVDTRLSQIFGVAAFHLDRPRRGLLLAGHGHHLGWAFVSGRIAGRNAATAAESGFFRPTCASLRRHRR